jgi:WD40 repeat protein
VLHEFGPLDALHSTWDQVTDEIVVTRNNGEVQWWDPTSVELVRTHAAEDGTVWYIEVTRDHMAYSRLLNPSNGVSTVVIADKVTGEDVTRIENAYWARLSPGGRFAMVLLIDRQAAVIDVRDGSEVMRIEHGLDPYIAGSSIEWLGEEDRLLLPRLDGTVAHVDVSTGAIVDPFPNTLVGLRPVGIRSSPDGRLFAEADSDTSVRVYETDSHREVLRLDGHDESVGGVEWIGSDRLLSMDDVGRVIVWDLAPPSVSALPFVSAQEFPVHHDTFDDRFVLVSSARADGQLWDATTGDLVVEFALDDELQDVVTATHTELGLIAAPRDSGIRVYDIDRREWVLDLESEALDHALAFSPDGRYVLATSAVSAMWAGTTARSATALVDVATGEELWRIDDALAVAGDFLPDGKTVVIAGPRDNNAIDFATRFVDVSTGEVLADHRVFTWITDLAVSPDGASVIISQEGDAGVVVVYDVARAVSGGAREAVIAETDIRTRGGIKFVEYSPDGTLLFVGSNDGILRALDATDSDLDERWSLDNGLVITELRFEGDLLRFAVPAGLPVGLGDGPYGIISIPFEQSAFADWAVSIAAR